MKIDLRAIVDASAKILVRLFLSIVVPFILAAVVIQLTGHDARAALGALASGSTAIDPGPPLAFDSFNAARIAAEATPLLLCGLAVSLCLRAGLFNIGAAGQMTLGALAAAWIGNKMTVSTGGAPSMLAIVPLVAAAVAGGLVGAVSGWLRAYRNVHEVISTIMLNYVVIDVAQYFVANQLREPGSLAVQTAKLPMSLWLAPLMPGTSFTTGAIIALVALAVCAVLIARTAFGFRVRALGAGPDAARATGMPIRATTVQIMILGGMLAGIAGGVQVLGNYHRCIADVAGNYGFQGIAVALLAGGSAPGMLLSSLFFGGLNNGATIMQLQTGVPAPLVDVVQAIVIVASALRTFGPVRLPRRPLPTAAKEAAA